MLWQRNNQRMDIYDVNSNRIIDTLSQEPGVFSAPAWSPVDDRLLFGSLNEENQSTDLVIAANSETNTLAPRLDGVIYFSWSPDGDKVAYTSEQGPLIIVDAVTGETVADSAVSGVLAFFWSPDSQHIAYITLATPPSSINAKQTATQQTVVQEATGIAWSVMDVEETTTRRYGSFVPTREMLYLLVYFDQFSQSHRVWSPDSRYLLYSETTANGRASINILDTTQSNIVPFSIAEGLIGVWSFS
jgi:TolB protein